MIRDNPWEWSFSDLTRTFDFYPVAGQCRIYGLRIFSVSRHSLIPWKAVLSLRQGTEQQELMINWNWEKKWRKKRTHRNYYCECWSFSFRYGRGFWVPPSLGESPSPRKTPMLYRLSGLTMAGQDEVDFSSFFYSNNPGTSSWFWSCGMIRWLGILQLDSNVADLSSDVYQFNDGWFRSRDNLVIAVEDLITWWIAITAEDPDVESTFRANDGWARWGGLKAVVNPWRASQNVRTLRFRARGSGLKYTKVIGWTTTPSSGSLKTDFF